MPMTGNPMTAVHLRQHGMTLFELLVVISLLGLMLGLAGASFVGGLDSVKIRRAGKDVMTALRYTRGQAIITREEQSMKIDTEELTFEVPGKEKEEFPEGIEISLKTAASDILDNRTGRIRFFPDGSSTGAQLRLTAGEREWLIEVGWLTGEIKLYDSAKEET